MKRTIFFGGLVLWALAAGAEARDWGFDKDTVYEWKAGGDTALLVNNASESLLVDSFLVEMIFPDMDTVVMGFYTRNPTKSHSWTTLIEEPNDLGFSVPPQGTKIFTYFEIDRQLGEIVSQKVAVDFGDTLAARLRILAGAQEDTLIVMGTIQSPTTHVRYRRNRLQRDDEVEREVRDIKGRAIYPDSRRYLFIPRSK